MPVIHQLSPHIANLIAAGEVVERPASVVKELLENAIDAGADKISIEIQNGGMTFLRVTDNGCGMEPEDAKTAFLRHATSKLKSEDDLASIETMGFRGEALAAIASVSRIDLMTKTKGALSGTSLHLEGGNITEESEVGCPDGTTIIIRDLFYNTPARMKFMKSDTVEGSRVSAAVQLQALAHPGAAITFIRDGKQVLSTPGKGGLQAAVYCVYGRECAGMIKVDSKWEKFVLTGFVCKPTDARPSRNLQTFFVNGRPVKSRLLMTALEEAYRNQIMVGKFPTCVLHLSLPASAVDVNVHPAKTEVKFLNEKSVFDCIHYGVLSALNQTTDRPEVRLQSQERPTGSTMNKPAATPSLAAPKTLSMPAAPSKEKGRTDFFRTMTSEEFKTFSEAIQNAPQPQPNNAAAAARKIEKTTLPLRETVMVPRPASVSIERKPADAALPELPDTNSPPVTEQFQQAAIAMQETTPWRMVGELYRSYILVEQGEDAYLIDKHAAHERILFDKLKANQEKISGQTLLIPVSVRLTPNAAAQLLASSDMLSELGFEAEEFGENTVLLRQIPMDLSPDDAAETIESIADDLLNGRAAREENIRDEVLHTVACKAAIKAGWKNSDVELLAVVKEVMARDDLKYCPHGRPICISLSKKQLEKQFKRT